MCVARKVCDCRHTSPFINFDLQTVGRGEDAQNTKVARERGMLSGDANCN